MRLMKIVLTIEAVAFTTILVAFFIGSLVGGLANRTQGEFAFEMATLVGVFAAIWAFGLYAARNAGITAWGSIALRFATMGMMFFTQPGLMVGMLVLLPSTLLLLLGVYSRRLPASS
ncbi:MAG: hypothetical protein OXL97_04340 [Chloroflexota bacterium]|nr:hypothetical protein [Chloroflexota bacterium]MDE2883940.1 hypothetical protein [Chloroflexota bacterium]